MSRRAAAWAAWLLLAVTAGSVACAAALAGLMGTGLLRYALAALLGVVSCALVGAVIASRRLDNPVGWFLLCGAACLALQEFTRWYATYGLDAGPGSLPLAPLTAWLLSWIYIPGVLLLLSFLPLYFPDGRLASPRWRWVVRLALLFAVVATVASAFLPGEIKDSGLVNPLGIEALRPVLSPLDNLLLAGYFGVLFASAASLVVRFRRSRGVERQQIKWLAYAASVIPAWFLANGWVVAAVPPLSGVVESGVVDGPLLAAVPIAVGIAVLRYRLYDIDVIINRTLVYGSLTAALVAIYFGGIVVLQRLFVVLTGGQSTLAVVASTLLIAALFNPLRRRIQSLIDRRFYRRKYDAAKVLAAFNTRLRNETNLDALSSDLVGVASRTVQPEHVSVWLRPEAAHRDGPAE